ncbi:unnamed protein product [Ectocarpus sp. 12 AP-2014]
MPSPGTPRPACHFACRSIPGVTRGSAPFGSRRGGDLTTTTATSSSKRPNTLVTFMFDDFKRHRDKAFTADLAERTSTSVILIPRGLTPLLQPLNCMLNRQTKRLPRGKKTAYTATALVDHTSGKPKPPGRGMR